MKNKKGFLQGALVGALVVFIIMGLVSCGIVGAGRNIVSSDSEQKLSALRQMIDENYLGEVDDSELTEGLYKGYMEALGDPYSEYYDEKETKELTESISGEFSGVGALLSQNRDTGLITITKVYENSPAMKAGLEDGDILYKVDGKDISGQDLDQVVSGIRGEKGTNVKLTVLRGAEAEEITVTAVRDIVEEQTIAYEMREGKIGYLVISAFDTVTVKQYEEALRDLLEQGMKGIVIDLRNNPGGDLDAVCQMLDLILPEGVLVYTEDKEGTKKEYKSDKEDILDLPMTVLVNGNSASASEIFAGAVQDYGEGKIVGTQTYGKGVVQSIFMLRDGSSVKLTVSEYFTPKGRTINGKGITPDVKVEYKYDTKAPTADNQLKKAIEELKKEM